MRAEWERGADPSALLSVRKTDESVMRKAIHLRLTEVDWQDADRCLGFAWLGKG